MNSNRDVLITKIYLGLRSGIRVILGLDFVIFIWAFSQINFATL